MDIQFDRYSLQLDGKRTFIRSGAMHYFRLPHHDLWRDRLQKLKCAGYNTVDIYFNWDYHSPAPGEYDFTGIRDVKALLDMIESLGLYLIARPGPYINAETTRGGLPGWLLTQPEVILRNRIEGAFQYSPAYMAFVREWMDQILPFVKDRKNLLMVQVENEYSTLDMEPEYMEELVQMFREHGITVPTMHNDFYGAGLYADVVDIYAIDNYSVTDFELDWRTFSEIFSVLDHLEENIRPEFCPNRPMMMAELQAGWFAGWKGVPYEQIHKSLGRDHIGLVTRSFIGQGGTLFNHYKAIGGTNWDHIGATDAYTSYDFSAPISESGVLTERLYEAKRINLLLSHFDLTQTERISPEDMGLSPSPSLYLVRKSLKDKGGYWIFTRNITTFSHRIEIKPGIEIEASPYQAKMIPYQMPLARSGWTLEAVNVEPLAQTPSLLILPEGSAETAMEIRTGQSVATQVDPKFADHIEVLEAEPGLYRVVLATGALAPEMLAWVRLGDYAIYLLSQTLADRLWALPQGDFLMGPDMIRSEAEIFFDSSRPFWKILSNGELQVLPMAQTQAIIIPELTSWTLTPGATPLFDSKGYQPLMGASDMDSHHIHEGAVWYEYEYTGPRHQLSLHAQHIWAVFLNGECVLEGHTFHVHPDVGTPADKVTIALPQESQNPGKNRLVVFVESLGHHKGFYEDTHDPRGIIQLKLDEEEIQGQGRIQRALLDAEKQTSGAENPLKEAPVLYASTEFDLKLPPEVELPLGLYLDLDIERVNIILNGVLIGQYWRSCKNQTLFYLPEGILRRNGLNQLELALMNFLPPLSIENPFPGGYGRVALQPYQKLFKVSH